MDYKFPFEDGSEAIYHSDLYHGDHKYIRKFMQNGKWAYEYAADKAKKAASGAKWLGQAVVNDLTDKERKTQTDRDNAKRKSDSYLKEAVRENRLRRRYQQDLDKVLPRDDVSTEYKLETAVITKGAKNRGRDAMDKHSASKQEYERLSKELETMPSLKRKISELLNKKKKK